MPALKSRKIALCVGVWGSEESIYAWKWTKKLLLQTHADGSPGTVDQLFILHVGKGKERERWDAGGPIIPDVRTATSAYGAAVKEIEGDPGDCIVDFIHSESIDVVILGSRGRGNIKRTVLGSITEYILNRVHCAILVARPKVVPSDAFRRKSTTLPADFPGRLGSPTLSRLASTPAGLLMPFNRRVCIAYDHSGPGRYLMNWAAQNVLFPSDVVFVVRAIPKKKESAKKESGKKDARDSDDSSSVGKDSIKQLPFTILSGAKQLQTHQIQGNAKSNICQFVENESIDLLVIGTYKAKVKKVGLTARKVALYMFNKCACPTLVATLTEEGVSEAIRLGNIMEEPDMEEEEEDDDEEDDEEDAFGERLPSASELQRPAGIDAAAGGKRALSARMPSAKTVDGVSSTQVPEGQKALHDVGSALAGQQGTFLVEIDRAGKVKRLQPFSPLDTPTQSNTPTASNARDGGLKSPPRIPTDEQVGTSVFINTLQKQLAEKEAEIVLLRQRLEKLQHNATDAESA